MLIDETMARAILSEANWRRGAVSVQEDESGRAVVLASGGYPARDLGSAIENAKEAVQRAQDKLDALLPLDHEDQT